MLENKPTEKQIKYAKSLGIKIPKDITKNELSDLISKRIDFDFNPPTWLIEYANNEFGFKFTKYAGFKKILNELFDYLKNNSRNKDLICLFIYSIINYKLKLNWEINIYDLVKNNENILNLVDQISNEERIIKSIKKYNGQDLITFNQKNKYKIYAGSKNTIAFKNILNLLNEEKIFKKLEIKIKKNNKKFNIKGCIINLILFLVIIIIFLLIKNK